MSTQTDNWYNEDLDKYWSAICEALEVAGYKYRLPTRGDVYESFCSELSIEDYVKETI